MTEEIKALRFNNVSFGYGARKVITDATFDVPSKSMMTVLGPNGGGKTTLLRLILGLNEPDEGEIEVLGRSATAARGTVGYMPQHMDFDTKFPISVIEVVLMGLLGERLSGWYSAEQKERARNALDEVNLSGTASRPFSELSGGQRQRVLMARAIVSDPKLLLLDEPTSNIDVESEVRLRDILLKLNSRMTILMVSHDLGFVADFVETVICVNRRVLLHPTKELTGDMIHGVYEDEMRAVRHDFHHHHDCELHSETESK
jgi:zinc transport system ATP-binding protein